MILNMVLDPEFVYIQICISRAIAIDMGGCFDYFRGLIPVVGST